MLKGVKPLAKFADGEGRFPEACCLATPTSKTTSGWVATTPDPTKTNVGFGPA